MLNFGDNNIMLLVLMCLMLNGGMGYGDDNSMMMMLILIMCMSGNSGINMCENK